MDWDKLDARLNRAYVLKVVGLFGSIFCRKLFSKIVFEIIFYYLFLIVFVIFLMFFVFFIEKFKIIKNI